MYFCYYQKIDLNYFFQKIRFGNGKPVKNDIQKLNLKGQIKSYKVISMINEIRIIEELRLDNNGNILSHLINEKNIIYSYYKNSKLSKCKVYNRNNELVLTEFFSYDDRWKLISKKVFDQENYKNNYEEYYEYDLRNNITAIIKQYEFNDDIKTLKYNKFGFITDEYYFTNNTFNGRTVFKEKYSMGGKNRIKTKYTPDNDILFETNSLLNDKNDVISELDFNVFGYLLKNNNATKSINYIYTYDKYDNWIIRKKFSEQTLNEELKAEIEYYDE